MLESPRPKDDVEGKEVCEMAFVARVGRGKTGFGIDISLPYAMMDLGLEEVVMGSESVSTMVRGGRAWGAVSCASVILLWKSEAQLAPD